MASMVMLFKVNENKISFHHRAASVVSCLLPIACVDIAFIFQLLHYIICSGAMAEIQCLHFANMTQHFLSQPTFCPWQ